jgi:4-hydroxybenzoate polyprenyltransferase
MDQIKQYLAQFKILSVKVSREVLRWSKSRLAIIRSWCTANWPQIKEYLQRYAVLTRLNKPIGTFLLLWPTLWALWIAAEGLPSIHLLVVFILGTLLTRSAGCVMNDYADRHFDGHVERTKDRPLATGQVSNKEAFLITIFMLLIAFLLVLTTNKLTIMLSFFVIPIALIYPYMKRYTYLPQFFLGIAFSWGIPMAFAAQSGTVPAIVWLIFIANLLWTVVFDTIYAMVDREHDLEIAVKSTAILFDDADKTIIGIIQVLVLIVLWIVASRLELNWPFYVALFIAAGFSIYQQYLIKDRLPANCFQAFLNNNWFGATIFLGIALSYTV